MTIIAAEKGRNPVLWFFYGMFVPGISLIHIIARAARRCPSCAKRIRLEALVCPYCQHDVAVSALPRGVWPTQGGR